MPIERFKEGTGLTAKATKRYVDSLTDEETEELRADLERTNRPWTFEATAAVLEKRARDILEASHPPTDGSARVHAVQSPEWYANEILKLTGWIRGRHVRLSASLSELEEFKKGENRKQARRRRNDLDGLMHECLALGLKLYEAFFKEEFEPRTEIGEKIKQAGSKGHETVHGSAEAKMRRWQAQKQSFEAARKNGHKKTAAVQIAAEMHGVSERTIRRSLERLA